MPPKRSASNERKKSYTDEVVESCQVTLHIRSDNQLIIEKDSKITWNMVKYGFTTKEYKAGIEYIEVYIVIQRLTFHKEACKFSFFLVQMLSSASYMA